MAYGASISTEWTQYREELLAAYARANVPATVIDDMKQTRSWKAIEKRSVYKRRWPERWADVQQSFCRELDA